MAAQARSARKRPLGSADESGGSEGNESSGSLSEWQPSPSSSQSEMPGTSSRASDGAGQQLVIAPPPEQTQFESWKAFEDYLRVYQAQSFQVFRMRTNTTAADRNAKMDTQGSKAPRIPVEWVQYARTFVCTHHGKYLSTATSKRPRQETRAQGCNAQINTCVQVVDKASKKFAVKITKCRLEHNHRLSEYAFTGHSSNRVSIPDKTLQTVDELRKTGAKKNSILKFIKENSDSNPTAQDAHNLVRKLKDRENGKGPSSSAKRLKTWMSEFGDRPGNVGRIFVDEVDGKKIATCITLQTKHMRSLFKQFPEVLLIDATHGTNRSKYKVFSFMAHDTFGKGQFVQHALLQNERWPTLLTALEEFKTNNPAWTKLQCILIDKDFTEMSVLKKAFPNVAILLCQFHVLKYLREEIASFDYGFTSWQKEQLRGVMSLLVYAKTETEYVKHFQYMVHLVEMGNQISAQAASKSVGQVGQVGQIRQRTGLDGQLEQGSGLDREEQDMHSTDAETLPRRDRHPFIAYFVKNWDECRDLWCAHKRQNTVTLGNNTNNRLEASWKQLKDWVNSFMAVDECIASIMYFQSLQERRYMDDVYKKVNVQHVGYDNEMSLVANLVSEHACGLIYTQYSYALGRASYTFYEGCPGVYFVKSTCKDDDALDELYTEYSVSKRDWTCSCLFMSTRLLPCRHVFFLRRALQMETVIPTQLMHQRWLLSSVRSAIEFESTNDSASPVESFAVRRVMTVNERPWDSNRKYREAFPIASEICDSMAGLGMRQHREAMADLLEVARRFKRGDFNKPASNLLSVVGAGTAAIQAGPEDAVSSLPSDSPQPSTQLAESQLLQTNHTPESGVTCSSATPNVESDSEWGDFGASDSQSGQVVELGKQSGESGTQSGNLGESGTQSGDLGESGTQSGDLGESGTQSGDLGESGKQSGDSGDSGKQSGDSGDSGKQSGKQTGDSGTQSSVSEVDSNEPSATLQLAQDSDFEIASPPRSRGRPKQSAKAKKDARSKAIARVQVDSEMYASQLSLANLQYALDNQPTYDSAAALISRFKLFEFTRNPKAPIARMLATLPPTKQVTRNESIIRIFRADFIKKCFDKVSALQKKRSDKGAGNLGEKMVVVEVIGAGTFSTKTLGVMKMWYKAKKTILLVKKAVSWIETVDITLRMPSCFKVNQDPNLVEKLKSIPLLSTQAEALELVGKSLLGDNSVDILMSNLFASRADVIEVDTGLTGNVLNGFAPVETMHNVFLGVTTEKILIPVICGKNHWCSIMMDLSLKEVFIYDPMNSTYGVNIRPLAEKLVAILPDFAPRKYRTRAYQSDLGVQVDSYNCGIYMLVAFEIFCGAECLSLLSKKEIQYLRYRYLCMCI